MQDLDKILAIQFLGNDLRTYAVALLVIIAVYIFFRFLFMLFFSRLEKYAKHTKTDIDDTVIAMIENNQWVVFLTISMIYIDVALKFTEYFEKIVHGAVNIVVVFLIIRVLSHWVGYTVAKLASKKTNAAEQFSVEIIGKSIKFLIWVFAILFLISSFGYNISSLIAGLGIGGLAIALAVQNILGDIISAVSIYLDKPFKVGDYIVVGTQMGTVKHIGLKTTRVTSLQGEEIVFSNKKLIESEINNFGKMKQRRVVIPIGVTYDTKLDKMKKVPMALQKIVKSVKDTTFDRAHFKTFADSSKIFELAFYVESKDYYTYLDRLQEVNLEIQKFFEEEKIEFAFPTQTVYLHK